MKPFSLLLALVLLIAAPSFAQQPIADTIPQLKEWWRADNMQYAKYGMTWLDNFYNGKGALVVWTPQGVKTWLLRFPGDTMNVFTWEKGSSNIRTGDFNGDKITDYIDENGYIYEGIKNGEPPKAEISGKGFYPSLVSDVNGDGYDDMLASGAVIFGKTNLNDLQTQTLTLSGIDSNNAPIASYMVSKNEMRIICRHYYWTNNVNYPFRMVYKDGLRLVRAWWDGNAFKSEVLDEFTVNTQDGTGLYWVSALLPQPVGKYYFVCATQILGKVENTNLTVYDISNDKLEKKYNTRIDRISGIGVLRHSIDGDTIQDWWVRYFQTNGYSDISFYSGAIQSDVKSIGSYNICQIASVCSAPIFDSNPQNGIALGGNDGDSYHCFRVVSLPKIVGVVNEDQSPALLSIEIITPQPVHNGQTLQILVSASLIGSYEISLFSNIGSNLITMNGGQISDGNKIISIPLAGYNLSKGVYWLRLRIGKKQVQQKLIIN